MIPAISASKLLVLSSPSMTEVATAFAGKGMGMGMGKGKGKGRVMGMGTGAHSAEPGVSSAG